MNIKLVNYFNIKNLLGEKIKSNSLRFGRNNHNSNKKNFLKQKLLSKKPIIKNILPKIIRLNSLNETKNKKFISPDIKENMNSYSINTNNKMFNIIPFRKSIANIERKERIKIINIRNKDKNPSYFTTIRNNNINKQNNNSIMNENENKMKKIRKIINLYYAKNDERINHNSTNKENNNINLLKEEENQNTYDKTINPNSMFMTEMNFLNNKKNKKIKNKEIKEVKNNKKTEYDFKNTNYDFLNFKELLKRIEIDKKKIINNQNDIDDMIKTTKDTYNEIWKYNHH